MLVSADVHSKCEHRIAPMKDSMFCLNGSFSRWPILSPHLSTQQTFGFLLPALSAAGLRLSVCLGSMDESQQAECVSDFFAKRSQFAMGVASHFTKSNDDVDNALHEAASSSGLATRNAGSSDHHHQQGRPSFDDFNFCGWLLLTLRGRSDRITVTPNHIRLDEEMPRISGGSGWQPLRITSNSRTTTPGPVLAPKPSSNVIEQASLRHFRWKRVTDDQTIDSAVRTVR